MKRLFDLRERLVPYLQEQMERAVEKNEPLIYPVFLKQPGYDTEADCFFCGDEILACPVFDEGDKKVTVLLPEGEWRLRGEGEAQAGGTVVTVPCGPEDLPVWFVRA